MLPPTGKWGADWEADSEKIEFELKDHVGNFKTDLVSYSMKTSLIDKYLYEYFVHSSFIGRHNEENSEDNQKESWSGAIFNGHMENSRRTGYANKKSTLDSRKLKKQ